MIHKWRMIDKRTSYIIILSNTFFGFFFPCQNIFNTIRFFYPMVKYSVVMFWVLPRKSVPSGKEMECATPHMQGRSAWNHAATVDEVQQDIYRFPRWILTSLMSCHVTSSVSSRLSCYVMSMSCYDIPCHVTSLQTISCHVTHVRANSHHVISCHLSFKSWQVRYKWPFFVIRTFLCVFCVSQLFVTAWLCIRQIK